MRTKITFSISTVNISHPLAKRMKLCAPLSCSLCFHPEPLEPYQRYGVALHTRPDQDTCNLKSINNTERTYASTQFYFQEGGESSFYTSSSSDSWQSITRTTRLPEVPVGAPTNISSHNLTLDSMVLQWTSIPEDDIRGFLLGYIIHYVEYHHRETQAERSKHLIM